MGVGSATGIGARIDRGRSGTEAALDRIAHAPWGASAGEAAHAVRTDGVGSARIAQTFVDILFAFHLSVSIVTRRAETLSLVGDGPAIGVDSAGVGFETRQDASVVLATLVHVAILVLVAFVLVAFDRRVSGVSAWAEADGPVVGNAAFSTAAARTDLARIFALSVDAGLFDGAIRVGFASGGAASDAAQLSGWALVVGRALETAAALDAGFSAAALVILSA